MAIDESISDDEREVALHVLQGLIELVGDPALMTVDIWRLHRVIVAMRGIVMEADQQLSSDADFVRTASHLATMIAKEAKNAREFRLKNGIGLMDLVLQADNDLQPALVPQ